MSDNWGTFEMNQESFHGLVYVYQSWDGYDLMNIFSISDKGDDIGIIYVYCLQNSQSLYPTNLIKNTHNNNSYNIENILKSSHLAQSQSQLETKNSDEVLSLRLRISAIYSEDYEHVMTYEPAGGNGYCTIDSNSNSRVSVSFPALNAAPSVDKDSFGVKVDGGTSLNITDGEGWVYNNLDGRYYNIIVFSTVDCSDCGNGGWYELHSFISNSEQEKACFGIFYLEFESKNSVLLEYSLCVPDLSKPDYTYTASWSGKLDTKNNVKLSQEKYEADSKFMSILRHSAINTKDTKY